MKKIDCHGHIIFEKTLGLAGDYGPFITREQGKTFFRAGSYQAALPDKFADGMFERNDPDWLAAELDKYGIAMLNVMASPMFYFYWAPVDTAMKFITANNDALAAFCAKRPDRVFWSALLPMQDVDLAVTELQRVAARGAKSVMIGTDTLGCGNLDAEAYWPLYQALSELDMPVFIHPNPSPIGGEEDRYNMSWVVGYPARETTAFAALTLGGVLDDFPKLRFHITHGGGASPFLFGRISGAIRQKNPGVRAKRELGSYLDNFMFDTTVFDERALRHLLDFMGPDRLFVGSNYSGWNWVDEFKELDALSLGPDGHAKLYHRNAERFFGLTTATEQGPRPLEMAK